MGYPGKLLLRAVWGGRVDPLEAQVDMVWQCFKRLAVYGGFLAQPWYSLRQLPVVPVVSHTALYADMTQTCNDPDGWHGFTQTELRSKDAPPNVTLSVRVSRPEGGPHLAANLVVADMAVGDHARDTSPLPVKWLLGIGFELVRDFVDIWHPDAVSLDSRELLALRPSRESSLPVVGYASWLSAAVADLDTLPRSPIVERYKGGMLLGIPPSSPDPVAEATRLTTPIYASRALGLIPPVQSQANG